LGFLLDFVESEVEENILATGCGLKETAIGDP